MGVDACKQRDSVLIKTNTYLHPWALGRGGEGMSGKERKNGGKKAIFRKTEEEKKGKKKKKEEEKEEEEEEQGQSP